MTTSIRFVHLPRPNRGLKYESSRFKASRMFTRAMNLIDKELSHIDARDVTIQAGFTPNQVKSNGWPLATAKPEHPGIILQFRKGTGKEILTLKGLRFASYEENLYAIALSLEALRTVARYGVVEGEQYTGFKQLPHVEPETQADRIRNLRDRATTPGERAAAQAALDRLGVQ